MHKLLDIGRTKVVLYILYQIVWWFKNISPEILDILPLMECMAISLNLSCFMTALKDRAQQKTQYVTAKSTWSFRDALHQPPLILSL